MANKTHTAEPEDLPWHWAWSRAYSETLRVIEGLWASLLRRDGVTEPELLTFLGTHAHFFFSKSPTTHFVLNELRLGGDFTIDFVVPTDQASLGIEYELIEVERPDTAPFNESGYPSARLSRAVQQIVDWKSWLADHTDELRRLFPAPAQLGPGYEHSFKYSIVIGTRSNTKGHLQRRNALAKTNGITIRTFDSLSDQIRKSAPYSAGKLTPSTEATTVPYEIATRLKNPFYQALGDAEWRAIRRTLRYHPHLVPVNAALFADTRRFNEDILQRFRDFCLREPPEELEAARQRSRELYAEALAPPDFDLSAFTEE